MYDEAQRKKRREYVNIGRRSVRTQHMGSREMASVGVEIVPEVSVNAFRTGWKFNRKPLQPRYFEHYVRLDEQHGTN
jgi:hypothetical protein